MGTAEKIGFLVDVVLLTLVIWDGYVERRKLFDFIVAAFENGRFAVRRTWHDDYEFVAIGTVGGREFHFRANRNEWSGNKDVELTILDFTSVRVAPWSYGTGNINERRDRPALSRLAHRLRLSGLASRRP